MKTNSCRPSACGRMSRVTGPAVSFSACDGEEYRVDYEPGESATRPFRGQFQLARAGLVPAQLPADRSAGTLSPFLRGHLEGRMSYRIREADESASRWPGNSARDWRGSFCRTRRAVGLVTAMIPVTLNDPHWRELVLFHEYFHGETGRGSGRQPSDRVDGPGDPFADSASEAEALATERKFCL